MVFSLVYRQKRDHLKNKPKHVTQYFFSIKVQEKSKNHKYFLNVNKWLWQGKPDEQ